MKTIRKWLEEDAGVTLSITSLTSYISRIRRRLAAKPGTEVAAGQAVQPQTQSRPNCAFAGYESGNGGRRAGRRSTGPSQAGSVTAETRHPQAP